MHVVRRAALAGSTVVALMMGSLPPAMAQQVAGMSELRLAEQQAAAAASATERVQAEAHLQAALNCLVGRGSGEYRPQAGDPCRGEGALARLPARSVNRIRVQKAIRLASVGVTFADFMPAHYTALAVDAVLREATR